MTVMAREKYAAANILLVKAENSQAYGNWSKIRDLLNSFCGYSIREDEVLLLRIKGELFFISDIGLRMLTPRELYDAMGFPHDYIIDHDGNGRPISRADQVARCGNAVCPVIAEAMARANLPNECLRTNITTLNELHHKMAI